MTLTPAQVIAAVVRDADEARSASTCRRRNRYVGRPVGLPTILRRRANDTLLGEDGNDTCWGAVASTCYTA